MKCIVTNSKKLLSLFAEGKFKRNKLKQRDAFIPVNSSKLQLSSRMFEFPSFLSTKPYYYQMI